MLNLRFDYGFLGRLFGVPRKFLSQVGAFCASLSSGHQIIDVRAPAFPDPERDPVKIGINEDAFIKWLEDQNVPIAKAGITDPVADFKDSPNVCTSTITPQLGSSEWTAGGANGLELDCYFHIQSQATGSNYSIFQRCRLTFSRLGLLVSAKMLAEGVRIQAKNA